MNESSEIYYYYYYCSKITLANESNKEIKKIINVRVSHESCIPA